MVNWYNLPVGGGGVVSSPILRGEPRTGRAFFNEFDNDDCVAGIACYRRALK